MASPTVYPVWLVAADGVTPIQVNDPISYAAAIAAGATYSASVPMVTVASAGGAVVSVTQLPLNPGQSLPSSDSFDVGVDC